MRLSLALESFLVQALGNKTETLLACKKMLISYGEMPVTIQRGTKNPIAWEGSEISGCEICVHIRPRCWTTCYVPRDSFLSYLQLLTRSHEHVILVNNIVLKDNERTRSNGLCCRPWTTMIRTLLTPLEALQPSIAKELAYLRRVLRIRSYIGTDDTLKCSFASDVNLGPILGLNPYVIPPCST